MWIYFRSANEVTLTDLGKIDMYHDKTQQGMTRVRNSWDDIDELMQERRNSNALAMELRLSCTIPPIYAYLCIYASIYRNM